ncbi:unnamed protein product [Pseudomonas synxantha]|nr:unnamed protein product [Pseudomonas synxantha]
MSFDGQVAAPLNNRVGGGFASAVLSLGGGSNGAKKQRKPCHFRC